MEMVELTNTIMGTVNLLDGHHSRVEMTEQSSKLEDRSIESTQCEQKREKRMKKKWIKLWRSTRNNEQIRCLYRWIPRRNPIFLKT